MNSAMTLDRYLKTHLGGFSEFVFETRIINQCGLSENDKEKAIVSASLAASERGMLVVILSNDAYWLRKSIDAAIVEAVHYTTGYYRGTVCVSSKNSVNLYSLKTRLKQAIKNVTPAMPIIVGTKLDLHAIVSAVSLTNQRVCLIVDKSSEQHHNFEDDQDSEDNTEALLSKVASLTLNF